ncbi:MAG: magnesium-translocating P-type ATPase [Methanotrichaceae archaeon]
MGSDQPIFWSISADKLLGQLNSSMNGLAEPDAENRLKIYGLNTLREKKEASALTLLLSQFKSPIILLLLFSAILSFFLSQGVQALIIVIILLISGVLGFWQEYTATDAVSRLLELVQVKVTVLRGGDQKEIPVEDIVPGDIILLKAGDIIPGDSLIIESKDLFVNEATLTGETYPVEKFARAVPIDTPLNRRINSLFMGTSVVSGTARAVVVSTGLQTEFGKVSQRLRLRPPETEFEHGVRHFGYMLMEVTLLLVVAIFAINVYLAKPIIDSFLFSLALAVGLTPQLLPATISINLAHGARRMAAHKVIVKRLASLENFGSMNVLCCDKTGTLTEGVVQLHSSLDVEGNSSDKVLFYAYLNSFYETGFANPIDKAILSAGPIDISGYKKLDEVPYDFLRKRLSILVSKDDEHIVITKGALSNILEVSTNAETSQGIVDISTISEEIQNKYKDLSNQGLRVLGLATRKINAKVCLTRDEADMTFLGFLVFNDPPKADVIEAISSLNQLGVDLKVITGDNRIVAASVGKQVGMKNMRVLTGQEILRMSDGALLRQVQDADIFAEIEPNQKERIILAMRKAGNVVGYMGDGINDASALHASDIGISVDSAVDVAKEAADVVLMEKDLSVLSEGVTEGRKTFSNTMKYVFMATSANFGNMFSMAIVSIVIPFLPLLPTQVLLTNLLQNFPQITIASDSVDEELIAKPRRWSIKFITDFMVVFGIISSLFDFVTFGALLLLLHASVVQFRTGWFIESVISASMVVLIIRTRRPFFKSTPGRYLLITTILVGLATFILPYTPLSVPFGFTPMPMYFLLIVIVIVALYMTMAEVAKRFFYQRVKY